VKELDIEARGDNGSEKGGKKGGDSEESGSD